MAFQGAAGHRSAALQSLGDASSCSEAAYSHAAQNYSDDFHVFGLLWTPEVLTFYQDGVVLWSVKNLCLHQPLALNFDRETMPDWFGLPSYDTLPDTPFTIDYIHAWTQPGWEL